MTDIFVIPGVYLPAVLPETIVAAGGLILLLAGSSRRHLRPHRLVIGALLFLAAGIVATILSSGVGRFAFDGTVARDGFATFLKLVFLSAALLSTLASFSFLNAEEEVPVT